MVKTEKNETVSLSSSVDTAKSQLKIEVKKEERDDSSEGKEQSGESPPAKRIKKEATSSALPTSVATPAATDEARKQTKEELTVKQVAVNRVPSVDFLNLCESQELRQLTRDEATQVTTVSNVFSCGSHF